MSKAILWASVVGLSLLPGCTHNVMREFADPSAPGIEVEPIDLNASIAKAKTEHKTVLLVFTGSDWCPPCMGLHKEILSKPVFQSYAESNLVFLLVDFPSKVRLPSAASATNDLLAQQFNVWAVPTLVALDGDGKKVWHRVGYLGGGPGGLIRTLNHAR